MRTFFFNSGSIDNEAGEATGTYGFIVGKANVSEPGIFISISFSSQDVDDRCTLTLSNVIVSNFTGSQMPVSVVNGSLTVGNSPLMPDTPLTFNEQSSTEGLDQNSALILCFVVLLLFAFRKNRRNCCPAVSGFIG